MDSYNLFVKRRKFFILFLALVLPISYLGLANGPEGGTSELAFDQSGAVIYRLTRSGLYKSTDGGDSWGERRGPINFSGSLMINPLNPNIMYSGTSYFGGPGGIAKSTDEGSTWRLSLPDSTSLVMHPIDPDILYATGYTFITRGLWKSTDAGETWNRFSLEGDSVSGLRLHPSQPQFMYVESSEGIRRSSDGGETWTPPGLLRGGYIEGLDPLDPLTLYITDWTDNRLNKTTDGGLTWRRLPQDPSEQYSKILTIDPTDTQIIYVGASVAGMHKSTDGGETWRQIAEFYGRRAHLHPSDPRTIYADARIGLAQSTDGGESWTIGTGGIVATAIRLMALAPGNPDWIYTTSEGWSRSTDGGKSWSPLRRRRDDPSFLSLAIDPDDPNILYGANGGVWKTTDGGDTWRRGLDRGSRVAVDPQDGRVLYAIQSNGPTSSDVYKSTDGGDNWVLVSTVGGQPGVLVVDPSDSRVVYAGGYRGCLSKSTDGGLSWNCTGLSGTYPITLTPDEQDPRTLYVVINPGGLFKSEDGGVRWNLLSTFAGGSLAIDAKD
ncbi:MAG: hypothetical protein HYR55_11800, partial [Acidobacteria bacterium]|nr:hypothetical protein [Acidobacteriota bacterium]